MRKVEFRWISRDKMTGEYDVWKAEPRRNEEGDYECSESGTIISRNAASKRRFDIVLKWGGLAKVTIERQYDNG